MPGRGRRHAPRQTGSASRRGGERRRASTLLTIAAAATTVAALLVAGVGSIRPNDTDVETRAATGPGRYVNPVSADIADTYADPSVIRGKDGWWYAYGTSDPLREGDTAPVHIPISRSSDLTTWTFVGEALTATSLPAWIVPTAGLWAPDIRYLGGRYVLYFTVTDTSLNPGDDSAIGVATAPSPAGPWTAADAPVVAPRPATGGGFLWTFDPSQFTDAQGRNWLYYGSYFGGIHTVPLSADGLTTTGAPTQVAIDNRYEGAYVVRHGDWYYLFASAANCCAGPTTGYSVFAGRAPSPTGPFVDHTGTSLLTSLVGGTPVIQPNGNTWIGTGHNAMLTDAAGQTWLAYHAIDRRDPFLNEPYGINERPMLLDRLDWIDDWPTVRAGSWASEGDVPAPVTSGPVDDAFERTDLGAGWRAESGQWTIGEPQPDSGRAVRQVADAEGTLVSTARHTPFDVRVEADVRVDDEDGAAGVRARVRSAGDYVSARIDRRSGSLVTDVVRGGRHAERSVPLPDGFGYDSWHSLVLHLQGTTLTASVSAAGLADATAQAVRALPATAPGRVGLVGRGDVAFDNATAAPVSRPVTKRQPDPRVGRPDPAFSDEFAGTAPGPGWSWLRQDPDAAVAGGSLRWPTQASDLVGDVNDAGVLVRDAPTGDYVVETKVTIDLGVDTVRNFQQAGLVAYANDDDFARLTHVAIWNTRQIEYGRELAFADRLSFGGMVLGPPADTTWLRLAHHVDRASGEHRLRAGSSRDGRTWTWGGTWTFPAGTAPRIGLLSQGGDTPQATALFDYVRVFQEA